MSFIDFPYWKGISPSPLPKIHVLSDLHLETGPYELPSGLDFDILVAAGDIGPIELSVPWLAKQGKPVVYVLGNHDRWNKDLGSVIKKAKELAQGTQVYVLEREAVEIQGVRFLGATLWTSFRGGDAAVTAATTLFMRDYEFIEAQDWLEDSENRCNFESLCKREGLDPTLRQSKLTQRVLLHPAMIACEYFKTVSWLQRTLLAYATESPRIPTIVVSHHSPCLESLRKKGVTDAELNAEQWSPTDRRTAKIWGYASPVLEEDLSRRIGQIDAWIHGHLHHGMDYAYCGTRIVCNPRGAYVPPLKLEDIPAFSLLGQTLTEEQVFADQAYRQSCPYLGYSVGFERQFILNLTEGYERPLLGILREPVTQIEILREELYELLPLQGQGRELVHQCVFESFVQRVSAVKNIALEVQNSAQKILVSKGVVPLAMRQELTAPGMCHLEWADTPDVSLYATVFDQVTEVLHWMAGVPFIVKDSLRERQAYARHILTRLENKGWSARLQDLPPQAYRTIDSHHVLWLEPPEGLPAYRLDAFYEIVAELEVSQTVPRKWLLNVAMTPCSGTTVEADYEEVPATEHGALIDLVL